MKTYFEKQIIDAAIQAIKRQFMNPVEITYGNYEPQYARGVRADAILRIKFKNLETTYCVEVKKNVTRPVIGNLLMRKQGLPHPLLLITEYVTGYIADRLKEERIEFLDTAGNTFLNQEQFYVFVKGHKNPGIITQQKKTQTLYATGLKVIFAFLYNEELLNKPYREIAKKTGVALGAVGWILRDLAARGYLLKIKGKPKKLLQKEKLFNLWNDEFAEKLRQKIFFGRFTGKPNWWKEAELDYKQVQWGGETAAAKLTKFLKPEKITLYTNKKYIEEVLLKYKLRRDENGDVEIYERFWTRQKNDVNETVPALLVYADLIATGQERNIEVAKNIYDEYIIGYIR